MGQLDSKIHPVVLIVFAVFLRSVAVFLRTRDWLHTVTEETVGWIKESHRLCSAEWHSAVSQTGSLRSATPYVYSLELVERLPNAIRRYSRLPVCATGMYRSSYGLISINFVLCCLFVFPGVIHALFFVLKR